MLYLLLILEIFSSRITRGKRKVLYLIFGCHAGLKMLQIHLLDSLNIMPQTLMNNQLKTIYTKHIKKDRYIMKDKYIYMLFLYET